MYTVAVLTSSDAGSQGERDDTSGQAVVEMASAAGFEVAIREVIPDDYDMIVDRLTRWSQQVNVILTTGGTGFGPRDVTPEATRAVVDRLAPGISEYMRSKTSEFTTLSYLSRGVSGTRGGCLIVNLPGSPRGVRQCLDILLPLLPHALQTMEGPTPQHPTESL
ncbi:MAG: MogA/MoaB family molybdenum cofactor biosynthesis protein [Chloroflexota bacterium]|nr:MogA/MoaB family molybdenum cofactor biosynthesis protein [Chloroflexota bacterium]MDE2969308.1 MogA/MoaB family molybdenum cofactor biosynthesis protein [Chloroflexota bacterium]